MKQWAGGQRGERGTKRRTREAGEESQGPTLGCGGELKHLSCLVASEMLQELSKLRAPASHCCHMGSLRGRSGGKAPGIARGRTVHPVPAEKLGWREGGEEDNSQTPAGGRERAGLRPHLHTAGRPNFSSTSPEPNAPKPLLSTLTAASLLVFPRGPAAQPGTQTLQGLTKAEEPWELQAAGSNARHQ